MAGTVIITVAFLAGMVSFMSIPFAAVDAMAVVKPRPAGQ